MFFFKLLLIFIFFVFTPSIKASVLDEVKERGYLICGVSEPRIGFANIDDDKNWIGFDVDMCRAVATAIFADPSKVEFIPTTNRSRFPILAGEEVDMLSRITTWTFSRDVNLGFEFTGINFYDGQGFMVKSSLEVSSAKELDGASVCIILGETSSFNIDVFFNKNEIKYTPVPLELDDEAFENFISGRCDVYSDYITELANKRISLPNSSDFKILPEIISKEPLGPLVRQGDDQWRDVVSWSLKVMIIAEELNITSKNIDNHLESNNNEILRLLGIVGAYGDMIELNEKWAYNIIKQVGNYKEVFNRHLGSKTLLNLDRGLNKLYTEGGLLFAPPFR
jgi:general L-amino acid transport system substrate-binding protein